MVNMENVICEVCWSEVDEVFEVDEIFMCVDCYERIEVENEE